jgi:hypothetical protein
MTDRELLEKAAKAAGIEWIPSETEKGRELEIKFGLWLRIDGEPTCPRRRWNPLTDDGDALRLSVQLLIQVIQDRMGFVKVGWGTGFDSGTPTKDGSGPWYWKEWLSDHNGDRQAATRRAIVRAAAAIGESL